MKAMNCREMGENIAKLQSMVEDFRKEIKDGNIDQLLKSKEKIVKLIDDIESNEFNLALRSEIAREKGYFFIGKFTNFGFARAQISKSSWTLIDMQGKQIGQKMSYIHNFNCGFAPCNISGNSIENDGIITENGKLVQAKRGDRWSLSNGILRLQDKAGDFFINSLGERINEQSYVNAGNFRGGLAWVRKFDENGDAYRTYIKTNGEDADTGKFFESEDFYDGLAVVKKLGEDTKLIDNMGNVVLDLPKLQIEKTEEHYKRVSYASKNGEVVYNFLGPDRKLIFKEDFEDAGCMRQGLAWVKKGNLFFIATPEGYLNRVYLEVLNLNTKFQDGVSVATTDINYFTFVNKYSVVNGRGDVLFSVEGREFGNYINGLAILKKNNTFVLVDKAGNQSEEFTSMQRDDEDFMIVAKKDGSVESKYILDKNGKQIYGPCENIGRNYQEFFEVWNDDKVYLLNNNLEIIRSNIKKGAYSAEDIINVEEKDGTSIWIDKKGNEVFNKE